MESMLGIEAEAHGGQPGRTAASDVENKMIVLLWASSLPFMVMDLSVLPDVPDWAKYGFRVTVIGFNSSSLLARRLPKEDGSGRASCIRGTLMWHTIAVWIVCKCWPASMAIWLPFIVAMLGFQVLGCRWLVGRGAVWHVLITLVPSVGSFYMRELEIPSTSGRKLSSEAGEEDSPGEHFIVNALIIVCALLAGMVAIGYGRPCRRRMLREPTFDDVLSLHQVVGNPEVSITSAAEQAGAMTTSSSQELNDQPLASERKPRVRGVEFSTMTEVVWDATKGCLVCMVCAQGEQSTALVMESSSVASEGTTASRATEAADTCSSAPEPSTSPRTSEHVPDDGECHKETVDEIVREESYAHRTARRIPMFLPEGTPGYAIPEMEEMFPIPGAITNARKALTRRSQDEGEDQDEQQDESQDGDEEEHMNKRLAAILQRAACVNRGCPASVDQDDLDREDFSSEMSRPSTSVSGRSKATCGTDDDHSMFCELTMPNVQVQTVAAFKCRCCCGDRVEG